MTIDENTEITVHDWLQFLQAQKEIFRRDHDTMTPRFIGLLAMFFGSVLIYDSLL